jgi:hypothetical protein
MQLAQDKIKLSTEDIYENHKDVNLNEKHSSFHNCKLVTKFAKALNSFGIFGKNQNEAFLCINSHKVVRYDLRKPSKVNYEGQEVFSIAGKNN